MPTRDPKLLAERRKLRCMACGSFGVIDAQGRPTNEAHHILPKGMGNAKGGDDWWNILTLCTDDHTAAPWAWHRNLKAFFRKYPHLITYLKFIGWMFLPVGYKTKLIHPAYRDCKKGQKPEWQIPKSALDELGKNKTDHMEDQ